MKSKWKALLWVVLDLMLGLSTIIGLVYYNHLILAAIVAFIETVCFVAFCWFVWYIQDKKRLDKVMSFLNKFRPPSDEPEEGEEEEGPEAA